MKLEDLPAEIEAAFGLLTLLPAPPQGMTSAVARVQSASGTLIIKRAEGALYGGWLAQEYRVLTTLSALPALPVPRPRLWVRRDTGVTPERFLVMDDLPGQPLAAVLDAEHDPARRATLLTAFGAALAQLHAAPLPGGLPQYPHGWLEYMLDEAAENLEHFSVDGSPELLARLRSDRPTPITPTLIHGDYTIDNVLVHAGRISGIIDWSGGALGDPRYDVALAIRTQPEAFGATREADLAAFYAGYARPPITQAEFDYFNGLYEFF
jgi:aminoglycoside phosphotransferase (APT) family kinase protein